MRGDVESKYGQGFKNRLRQALLDMGGERPELMVLFSGEAFIATSNGNYAAIEDVARKQGIIE